jgi:hypothetical protein
MLVWTSLNPIALIKRKMVTFTFFQDKIARLLLILIYMIWRIKTEVEIT